MSELSKRIMNAIENQNISYGELSAVTGIPKSALHRYATGETEKIPMDRLELIAAALHIPAQVLLGWQDEAVFDADTGELFVHYLLTGKSPADKGEADREALIEFVKSCNDEAALWALIDAANARLRELRS